MATASTGISVAFNGAAFQEVVGLSWNRGGGMPQSRGGTWTPESGDVSIEMLGGVSPASHGARGTLTITGGGMGLTATAVCTGCGATAEVNGVTRFSATFTIIT